MDFAENEAPQDERLLAQERILDALLRALALQQPSLLASVRTILVDTEFTHPGKPAEEETVHQQIQKRIEAATNFAETHGAGQA